MSASAKTQTPIDASTLIAQEISAEVLLEKYAKGDERNVTEVRQRVARALAAVEATDKRAYWEARFLEAQDKGFVPAGRINSAAGTTSGAAGWCSPRRRSAATPSITSAHSEVPSTATANESSGTPPSRARARKGSFG